MTLTMHSDVSHKRFYSQFFYTKPNFSILESTSHTHNAGMLQNYFFLNYKKNTILEVKPLKYVLCGLEIWVFPILTEAIRQVGGNQG